MITAMNYLADAACGFARLSIVFPFEIIDGFLARVSIGDCARDRE